MKKRRGEKIGCFERASPALKEILLKLYHSKKPLELDHRLYEFGSVEYHVQKGRWSSQFYNLNFLNATTTTSEILQKVSTPLLSQGVIPASGLPCHTLETVKAICPDVLEIIQPPKEGYQITLRLDFSRIPRRKDPIRMISDISSLQAVILSSQLKQILWNVNSLDVYDGTYKPIKLVYHPREPFYVIKQPTKITVIFPMRFKENTDVIIATAFFQEIMDVGSREAFSKAPHCIWSPIPPPELRGELIEDLSTNGGFLSFDITSRHVEGKKLDKTVWNLLNFYALVKYHVKSTRGFIQRRMRNCLENLVEVLTKTGVEEDQGNKKAQAWKHIRKLVRFSKSKIKRQRRNFKSMMKRLRSRLRIRWFSRFRQRWLKIPKFSSVTGYTRLDKF